MGERPLGRNVVARQRFARLFSIGDRGDPGSWTPGLVLGPEDSELPVSIAPFSISRSKVLHPANSTVSTRSNLCFPFDSVDEWKMVDGLVLPPSLVESDSGEFGSGGELLPISWNSLHHDERISSVDFQPSLVILTDAPQLAKLPGMLEKALIAVRTNFPASLIWTPGISGPDNCALLSWMGVDIFDLSRSRHASSLGILLTESGPRFPEDSCGEETSMQSQCEHWIGAISETRSAIRNGTLRELAERSSTSSPKSVEHLRLHDRLTGKLSEEIGILSSSENSGRKMRCYSFESRNDPTIQDWRRRVSELHMPPEHQRDLLVLLPCSAKKPYKLSQSHSRFRRALKSPFVHEVMVTSPLGLVPREIEEIWPAAHYDIPVTGDWDEDELSTIHSMISQFVRRVGYSKIINHSGIEIDLDGIETIDTREGESAGSKSAISRLSDEVEKALKSKIIDEFIERPRMMVLKSISRFIHGSDEWLEGADIRGRPPILTIFSEGTQIAKWNPKRGMFSFSKSSLGLLDKSGTLKRISLNPNVNWTGDIFPSYVDSFDPLIRSGEELLVFQKSKLMGSARSVAPGWEWPHGPGKLAKARHRL